MVESAGRSVATVYVSLALTAQNLSSQIRKEIQSGLKGVDFDKAVGDPISKETQAGAKEGAKKGNKTLLRELPKGLSKLGKPLGRALDKSLKVASKGLKVGVGAVGGGIAAGLGTALTAGFRRMSAIENAKASIAGLGYSLETVEKVGTNALAAVRGTAFGLGDAYSAAARGLGAGVKEGKEMEKYLSAISNITTLAGANFNEVSAVLGKMAANGKVSGETLAQLEDRGFGASAALAKHFSVSQAEVRKMISEGEVSMKDFMVVMEQYEGAALKSGDTTAGALANTMAAFGRLGETLMGDSYELIRLFAIEITAAIDGIQKVIEPAMQAINADIRENLGGGLEGAGERFAAYLMRNQEAITDFMIGSYATFRNTVEDMIETFKNINIDPDVALGQGLTILEEFSKAIAHAMATAIPIIELIGETGILTLMLFITQLTVLLEAIIPIIEQFNAWWNGMSEETQSMIAGFIAASIVFGWAMKLLAPIFKMVWSVLRGAVKAFKDLRDPTSKLRGNISKIGGSLKTWGNRLKPVVNLFARIGSWVARIVAGIGWAGAGWTALIASAAAGAFLVGAKIAIWLTGWQGDFWEVINGFFQWMLGGVEYLWQAFINMLKSISETLRKWNPFKGKNSGWTPSANNGSSWANARTASVPLMGTGGDVLSPTLLIAGEKDPETIVNRGLMNDLMSEVIRDLRNNRSGNSSGTAQAIQIDVHPSAGMDERALADAVVRQLAWEGR